MEKENIKIGTIVFVKSQTDTFFYQLKEEDIDDINKGEWEEVGLSFIENPGIKIKMKEIYKCFKFGLLPYWCYEKEKHYFCSYWKHLGINMREFYWLITH